MFESLGGARRRQILKNFVLGLMLGLVLAACGGGGSDETPPDAAPVLQVQPVSQSVSAGSAVSFSVAATGSALQFQWQRSVNAGSSWSDIVGAVAASYSLAGTDSTMNGHQFRVIVRSGTASSTSAVVTLSITPPPAPVIAASPQDLALVEGSTATFSVSASGNALQYQWQSSTDGGTSWAVVAGATGDALALGVVTVADNGKRFRAVVSNEGGAVPSAAALLTVTAALTAPTFTQQPSDASGMSTRTVTFTAAAGGNPAPVYQWERSTDGGLDFNPLAGATSASYTTPPLALSDNGTQYRVRASNPQGSVLSRAARLTVTAATGPGFTQAVLSMSSTTCAAQTDGGLWCWGASEDGQVPGTLLPVRTPRAVPGFGDVVSVASGFLHGCAARSNGSVFCWGTNSHGELGGGQAVGGFQERFGPRIVTGLTDVQAVVAGYYFSCALRSGGTVACWGRNQLGQLGDGTFTNRPTAQAVPGLDNVKALTAGDSHSCALRSDGTVLCWGSNISAQLGDGSTTSRSSPTVVPGLDNAVAVAAGPAHTCAVRADGTVVCWGTSSNGATGSTTTLRSPRAVVGMAGAAAIGVGRVNSCAVRADGSVACWGFGLGLGVGFASNRTTPIDVPSLAGSVAVTGGTTDMCAIKADGSLYCWGSNIYAQIGDGTQNASTVPKRVSGFAVRLR